VFEANLAFHNGLSIPLMNEFLSYGEGDPDKAEILTKHARHVWISSEPLRWDTGHERCNLGARWRWGGIEDSIQIEKRRDYYYEHSFSVRIVRRSTSFFSQCDGGSSRVPAAPWPEVGAASENLFSACLRRPDSARNGTDRNELKAGNWPSCASIYRRQFGAQTMKEKSNVNYYQTVTKTEITAKSRNILRVQNHGKVEPIVGDDPPTPTSTRRRCESQRTPPKGLRLKTNTRAGGIKMNHNQILVRKDK
jgi:hypothetical protein